MPTSSPGSTWRLTPRSAQRRPGALLPRGVRAGRGHAAEALDIQLARLTGADETGPPRLPRPGDDPRHEHVVRAIAELARGARTGPVALYDPIEVHSGYMGDGLFR